MRLKLVGAATYTGPRTGGAALGKILKRGDIYDFKPEDAVEVLKLTNVDERNNSHPLFERVGGDEVVGDGAVQGSQQQGEAGTERPDAPAKAVRAPRTRAATARGA